MQVRETTVRRILTRAGGFLRTVCSHSLQPYRGCSFGGSLCGVGCYAKANPWLTTGRQWGTFLEARTNAAAAYLAEHERERRWARRMRGAFAIFLSSSTDPFVPHEEQLGVTHAVLEAMLAAPPDALIVQTHGDRVAAPLALWAQLGARTRLRFHLSIESDRERLPGLPPPACSVERRLRAAATLRAAGHRVVVTVAPLLPLADADAFFVRLGEVADAVVIDHYIGGDGSAGGTRTVRTALPAAMAAVDPQSLTLAWRDRIVARANELLPGRVGVGADGFAGRLLPPPSAPARRGGP